jgi:hypothetical protein
MATEINGGICCRGLLQRNVTTLAWREAEKLRRFPSRQSMRRQSFVEFVSANGLQALYIRQKQ